MLLCGSSVIARGATQDTSLPTPSSRPSSALSNARGSPAIFPLVPALNVVQPASAHRGIPNTLCSTGTMVRDQRAVGLAPQPLGLLLFGRLACLGRARRADRTTVLSTPSIPVTWLNTLVSSAAWSGRFAWHTLIRGSSSNWTPKLSLARLSSLAAGRLLADLPTCGRTFEPASPSVTPLLSAGFIGRCTTSTASIMWWPTLWPMTL